MNQIRVHLNLVLSLLIGLASMLVFIPSAAAIGEHDNFQLPLKANSLQGVPGKSVTFVLDSLMAPDIAAALDLSSVKLVLPQTIIESGSSKLQLSADETRIMAEGEGEWLAGGGTISFTPQPGFHGTPTGIRFTVASKDRHRSAPVEITATYPVVNPVYERVSQGSTVSINLANSVENARVETVRMVIDGLPAQSTVTKDGKTVVIPGEGTWQLNPEKPVVTFTPLGEFDQHQPTPIFFTAYDKAGVAAVPAAIQVTTPRLPRLIRSASYGEPVEFPVGSEAENIDPATLQLQTIETERTEVKRGVRLEIPNEGEWSLNSTTGAVTFKPVDSRVKTVTPIQVVGTDDENHSAQPVLLQVGYPELANQYQAAVIGTRVTFAPFRKSHNVDPESIRLEGGNSLAVPGEGTWAYDQKTSELTFTPEPGFTASPEPVRITAKSLFNDNSTTANVVVVYARHVPEMHQESVRIRPGSTVQLAPLNNDVAATAHQPFLPATIQLSSVEVPSQQGVTYPGGKALVIPNQGSLTVDENAIVTFKAAPGFEGKVDTIDYDVTDSGGIRSHGSINITVDPAAPAASDIKPMVGQAELLRELTIQEGKQPVGAVVYLTICALLLFAGMVALWVGKHIAGMERIINRYGKH